MQAAEVADERFVASVEQNRSALYSVREVAELLGVHPETIRRLIHDGRVGAVRVGRVLRIESYEVDRFLARQRVKPIRLAD
jgi:excisionase family DNA binding protein